MSIPQEVRQKYPRTLHLPWSLGVSSDDKVLKDTSCFTGKEVVVPEKMDGENTTITRHSVYARSVDSRHHASRSWVKGYAHNFQHRLGTDVALIGENMYAKHSIHYKHLEEFFYLFAARDADYFLPWDALANYHCTLPKVLYRGVYDEELIKDLDLGEMEGYVVRLAEGFHTKDFSHSVAKCVRKNHVSTSEHWMYSQLVRNELRVCQR